MRRFLAEIAFDHAAVVDASIDHWRRINSVIQYDGHLPADVLLRKRAEAASRFRGERKVHDPLARVIRVAIFRGAAKVAAGDNGPAAQDVPTFALRCGRGS